MLKKDFIEKKIELIQQELENLAQLKGLTIQEVMGDFYKYNTLERLLEKIIMRAIDVNQHLLRELGKGNAPETYKETFLQLENLSILSKELANSIAKSVGLRNILVHDYDDEIIDYNKIYDAINSCLKDYHQYCERILKFIENN
jgi:uncharacterized protein YutE (UPF0331/DUF86 family)